MNILVVGNGFDLAHKLNTSYSSYLKTIEVVGDLRSINKDANDERFLWNMLKNGQQDKLEKYGKLWLNSKQTDIPQVLWEEFNKIARDRRCLKEWMYGLGIRFRDNFWINYFLENPQGMWIDFERDIKSVCQNIEKTIKSKNLYEEINIETKFSEIEKYICDKRKVNTYAALVEKLEKDLNKLTKSFEVYISNCINTQQCEEISPDIVSLEIDKVLSFNYSNTYERLYDFRNNVEFAYIHGKAGDGNLVLGYDMNENGIETEFTIPFKKYYQRVLQETDDNYLRWIEEIKENKEHKHNVYFFGHSMDITDRDVICDLILNENVQTTIYYYSAEDKKSKLQNLVNTLGYNNFKTYTKSRKIKLKYQAGFRYKEYIEEYKEKNIIKNLYRLPYVSNSEYEGIQMWIDDLKSNRNSKKKYIYMAIDALNKYGIYNNEWMKVLKNKAENLIWEPYTIKEFQRDFPNYSGDLKEENAETVEYIKKIDEQREKLKETSYWNLLHKLKVNHRMIEAIENRGPREYITKEKLHIIIKKFFDYFQFRENEVDESVYTEMAKFLSLVNGRLVEEMFDFYKNSDKNEAYHQYIILFLEQAYRNRETSDCNC